MDPGGGETLTIVHVEWPLDEPGQVVCQHLDGPVDTLQNTPACCAASRLLLLPPPPT